MINIGRNGKRNGGGMHSGMLGMGMGLHSDFTNSEWEWECIPTLAARNGNGNAFRKFPEWTDICEQVASGCWTPLLTQILL